MTEESISRKLARFALSLDYVGLPAEVVREVKRYLYDSIGCAYGGYDTEDVRILRDIYLQMGGKKEAALIGFGDKIPAVNATLINSLMIRALDFNDIFWREDPSHPSDLIPAALAVGELVNASMKDVIVAIVLGYEFEMRLCEFAVPGIRERKWHHATLTQFVSPVVAGKLLGLTENQMVNAIGISASHNYALGAPTAGHLTMMKNAVDPLAVQAGVFAALMAQKGFTGTEAIFEGKEGFMDVFGPEWDVDKLVGGLGDSFKILECSMKAFPTEALTHTPLTAVLKLVNENDVLPEEIEQVTVTTIARARDILFDPHKYEPKTRETADHSLPYCMTRAIIDRQITTESFSEERIHDSRVHELIHKIKGEASEQFEELFPEKQPSRVHIQTKDRGEFSAYLEYPKGDPREPMTDKDLQAKFNALAPDLLSPGDQESIRKMVFSCERMDSVRDFMKLLIL